MATKKKNAATELVSEPDAKAPLDVALLLAKSQRLLAELEADLLVRARGSVAVREALRLRHETERKERRTADPLDVWERHFVTQVAASWLLSCVFVRTLEDRGLLGRNRLAGPGAADSQRLFFELAPSLTEREYLLTVFRELTRLPAARELFDRHNPVWLLGPSAEVAKKLIALFRTPNAEAPGFRFGQGDTRFLGDLYQDLSADVRERFALLQTPHFVESYILDRTLERAIARFGLDETTLIDPTCGSGHFLLGAFERLFEHRLRKEPGLDVREAARRALDAVYGADINPYAVAIARFRLTLAFVEKAGYARLTEAPSAPLHLAVGDSLLHTPQQGTLGDVEGTTKGAWLGDRFALDDESAVKRVLFRRHTAVVGNPPYITVADQVLRARYKELYSSCFREFTLATPFTQLFFKLARSGGYVGMITENGFSKRERGKKLIESFLPTVNIDGIINASGAYIPGHGTPTALLFGSNEPPVGSHIVTVMAKRGEPSTPKFPEYGKVWSSVADHGSEVGFENDYVSVSALSRETLAHHPWSLGGGGAAELKELLEARSSQTLDEIAESIGFGCITKQDDLFSQPRRVLERAGVEPDAMKRFVIGEELRDWGVGEGDWALFPYDSLIRLQAQQEIPRALAFMWPWRRTLEERKVFGGLNYKDAGKAWYEYGQIPADRYTTPLTIAFAEIATHNHFVLDRGGNVFNRTAPIIKLEEGATEEDHLALLAYLNSSTACFWMKQVAYPKGAHSEARPEKGIEDENRYAFSATGLASLPIPELKDARLIQLARTLEQLAKERSNLQARAVVDRASGSKDDLREELSRAEAREREILHRMVAVQDDLDWHVYSLFDLAREELAERLSSGCAYAPDCRSFLVDQSPSAEDDRLWQARRAAVAHNPKLALIEQSVYKRKWWGARGVFASKVATYMQRSIAAIEVVTADAIEKLAEREEAAWTARRFAGRLSTAELAKLEFASDSAGHSLLSSIVAREAVPFLAALRYVESGLETSAAWMRVWDLQRAEDRGEPVSAFDPSPKYDQSDYRDATTWRLRGKLDVPTERFISYPGCESDEDKEPVYGWAGWNHLQQAQALAALYQKRKTEESWGKDRLTPMLAGLLELVPWVKQWHNEMDAEFGLRMGDFYEEFVDRECHQLGITREDLRAWRPVSRVTPRGRKKAARGAETPDEATPAEAD